MLVDGFAPDPTFALSLRLSRPVCVAFFEVAFFPDFVPAPFVAPRVAPSGTRFGAAFRDALREEAAALAPFPSPSILPFEAPWGARAGSAHPGPFVDLAIMA